MCVEKKLKSCEESKSNPNIWNYFGAFSKYMERIWTYTENTRKAWKVEYLGEFKVKIENILGRYQELRWVRVAKPCNWTFNVNRRHGYIRAKAQLIYCYNMVSRYQVLRWTMCFHQKLTEPEKKPYFSNRGRIRQDPATRYLLDVGVC